MCISETVRLAVAEACGVTPKGTAQMRRLRGMIQSGILGFGLSPNQMCAFVDPMMPINDDTTSTDSEGKHAWPAKARVAQEQIALK